VDYKFTAPSHLKKRDSGLCGIKANYSLLLSYSIGNASDLHGISYYANQEVAFVSPF
jgi:hypothetical protein